MFLHHPAPSLHTRAPFLCQDWTVSTDLCKCLERPGAYQSLHTHTHTYRQSCLYLWKSRTEINGLINCSRGLHISDAWSVCLWICSICSFLPPMSLGLSVDQFVAPHIGSLEHSSHCRLCFAVVCQVCAGLDPTSLLIWTCIEALFFVPFLQLLFLFKVLNIVRGREHTQTSLEMLVSSFISHDFFVRTYSYIYIYIYKPSHG